MAQLPESIPQSQSSTPSQRQSSLWSEWFGWVVLLIAIVLIAWSGYMLYQRVNEAQIEQIQINGIQGIEQQALAYHLKGYLHQNYLTTDLEQIRDQVLQQTWIEDVVVSREWFDKIVISVIPRHAIARWGTGRFLSDDGVVFQSLRPIANAATLPLLHGPQSQSRMIMNKYRDINQIFANKKINLTELYLTERMTWFMQFDNGLRVIVDDNQTMKKLQYLSQLSTTDLAPVWDRIASIDLRYRNGLAIQWKDGQAPKVDNGHFVVVNQQQDIAISDTNKP